MSRFLEGLPGGFRVLLFARLASEFGTWIAYIALAYAIYSRTGSATWVSILLLASVVPSLLSAFLLAPIVDRYPRRRLLVGAELASFAVFVTLPFANGPASIVALAFCAGLATSIFRPAMHSAVPNLVEDAALERASGILQMAENTALLAGPVVAGALVASVGVEACYLLNAASFLLSGVAIAAIRGRFEESRLESPTSAGHWLQLRNGLTAARGLRPVRAFLVCGSLVMLGVAALNVGEVVFAREVLDAGSVGFGLLAASSGVGLITGSWIFIRASRAATAEQLYARGLFLASLGLLAAAISPSLPVAMAALAITGLGNGVYNGALLVTVQRTVADELRGRIFALLRGAFNVFLLSAMALAGPAMAAFGVRLVWVVGAAAILAASLLSGLLLRSVSAVAALPERA